MSQLTGLANIGHHEKAVLFCRSTKSVKNEGVAIHHQFISEIASHLDLYLAIHFTYLLLKKDNLRVIDVFHRRHNLVSCTVLSKDTLTITETHQLLVSAWMKVVSLNQNIKTLKMIKTKTLRYTLELKQL